MDEGRQFSAKAHLSDGPDQKSTLVVVNDDADELRRELRSKRRRIKELESKNEELAGRLSWNRRRVKELEDALEKTRPIRKALRKLKEKLSGPDVVEKHED